MQKKVLVAAISGLLAAPAVFADVTISGRISAGFENYKVSGGTAPKYNNEQRVSDQSSNIIFGGSEDLGGGLKAWFQYDLRPSVDTGGSASAASTTTVGAIGFAQGNTQVGLAGDWGKLAIGRSDLHYNEMNVLGGQGRSSSLQSWLAPGPVSQVNGSPIANATRTPNVIMWDSANMGGITARVGYSTAWVQSPIGVEGSGVGTATNDNPGADGAFTAAIRWAGGPLVVGASIWDAKTEGKPTAGNNQIGDQKSSRAWAGYTMGAFAVGLGYDSSQLRVANNEAFTKRGAYVVPVTFKMGMETFVVSLAKMNKLSGPNGGATVDNTDASAISFGWDHALSKRTSVGAFYSKIDNKANAGYDFFAISANGGTGTALGEDVAQIYLGLAHFF